MSPRGRRVLTGPRSGAWNMALDEALLLAASEDLVTLRLYAWAPATVSLGYFQARSSVPPALARRYPLVRRPSGGGAIIHLEEEITLSLAGMARGRPPSPDAAARLVLAGMRAALEPLGIRPFLAADAGLAAPAEGSGAWAGISPAPFLCGAVRRPHDILAAFPGGPRKLMGTAQRRHGRAWLIHGGFRLVPPSSGDAGDEEIGGTSIVEALAAAGVEPPAAESPAAFRQRIAERVCEGFAAALAVDLEPLPLAPAETDLALRLVAERYACPAWLARR